MNFFNKVIDMILTQKILGTILTLIIAHLIIKFFKRFIFKILVKGKDVFEVKRRKTIIDLLDSILKYVIYFLALLVILGFYGIDTKSLVASFSVVGAVIGLALQDTFKDLISGISLILENYLAVGDIVTYNDFTGEVIELGLRVTKIKKLSGEVMIVANRNIDSIINSSQKKANLMLEIDTAYEEKYDKVQNVINDVIEKAKDEGLIITPSSFLGISELSSCSVKYLVSIRCDQAKRYEINREMLKRIKLAYEKNNIKIPYPQIEVHNGKDI